MNDNEGTIFQQIAHLEGIASTMREDLEEARAGLLAQPYDERLAKQVAALEGLLKGVLTKVERLRGEGAASVIETRAVPLAGHSPPLCAATSDGSTVDCSRPALMNTRNRRQSCQIPVDLSSRTNRRARTCGAPRYGSLVPEFQLSMRRPASHELIMRSARRSKGEWPPTVITTPNAKRERSAAYRPSAAREGPRAGDRRDWRGPAGRRPFRRHRRPPLARRKRIVDLAAARLHRTDPSPTTVITSCRSWARSRTMHRTNYLSEVV